MNDYKVLRAFTATRFGNLAPGELVRVPFDLAEQWIAAGMIEPLPGKPGTAAAPGSSSSRPAARASVDGSSNTYETKPLQSQPTQPTRRSARRGASTPATETGGNDTAKTSPRKGTKGGRQTRKRPRSSASDT